MEVEVLTGFDTAVQVGGIYTSVLVGLFATTAVLVTDDTVVGLGGEVRVVMGNGVPVTRDAPGVRKMLSQLGCVRMEGSTASMNPLGPRVRKSLFGLRLESILVSNCQPGAKRKASCPAASTHRKPITKMIRTTIQSFRPRSTAFMLRSLDRQAYKDSCAGVGYFIMTRAFQPDPPAMGIDNAAGDGQPKPRTATFEFRLA